VRHVSRLCRLLPLFAALLLLAGCPDVGRRTYATELDEPAFRQAQSLMKSGRRQEALTAFLNVIEKRGNDAPESHLEAGLLYLQHINDPLAAIYHFKKYLAIRPNSPQASLVRQRIDFAVREFAKTLPAQPLPTQFERIDLLAKIDRLQRENEDLKQQLADLKAGRLEALPLTGAGGALPAGSEPAGGALFDSPADSIPTVSTRPQPPVVRTAPPAAAVTTAPKQAEQKAAPPPAQPNRAARTHVVRQGDTLYKLADQYYRDKSRWRDIFAANRDVMKSETDLKIGMTLKIP